MVNYSFLCFQTRRQNVEFLEEFQEFYFQGLGFGMQVPFAQQLRVCWTCPTFEEKRERTRHGYKRKGRSTSVKSTTSGILAKNEIEGTTASTSRRSFCSFAHSATFSPQISLKLVLVIHRRDLFRRLGQSVMQSVGQIGHAMICSS